MKISDKSLDSKRNNGNIKPMRACALFILLLTVCLLDGYAQQVGIPPAVNTYDHFKAGEIGWIVHENNYWSEASSTTKDRIEDYRALLVRVRSSDRTLNAFDKLVELVKTLPVHSPRDQWSEEHKSIWNKSYQSFLNSFLRDVSLSPEADFFFRLGLETSYVANSLPEEKVKGINRELIADLKSEASWFVWFKEHDIFPTLSQEVQNPIQTIANLKSRIETKDPLEGEISLNDVDKMIEAARLIQTAAMNKNLLR